MAVNLTDKKHLIRGLGLAAAASVIIGNVIGTGVFFKARVMTCNLGGPEWVIIAWIAAGVLSLAGALTYAELTAMKPEAGGEYVFLRDAYGKVSSFLFGWMQMLVAKPGSQAAAGVAFAIGLNDFRGGSLKYVLYATTIEKPLAGILTNLSGSLNSIGISPQWTEYLFSSTINWNFKYELTTLQLIAILMIVVFTLINGASVKFSGHVATFLTFVKIALIVFVGVGAFIWASGTFSHFSLVNNGGTCEDVAEGLKVGGIGYTFLAGFGAAMLGALWGYDGWNNLTFVAGEVKHPGRNIPLAIIGSTILIIFLYVFVQIGYFYVLVPTAIASIPTSSSVGNTVVSSFFGGNFANFATALSVTMFTVGLMLSSLGTMHTSILAGSRVPYAMAEDGLLPKSLTKLSRTRVPVKSLLLQGIVSCILALSGSFDTLTDYVIFGSWIFYALVTSSIFVFRRKYPDLERPYKAFGYPVMPILFLLVAGWLLVNTIMTQTFQSVVGIFLIALGLPFYYYFTRRQTDVPTDPEPEI
jgi:APA family basic amino acid/polyamine antiporter